MKWMIWLCVLTAIGAGIVVAQRHNRKVDPIDSRQHATPDTATYDENRRIFASGVVEGAWREVRLRFEIEGRLATRHAAEGNAVSKGQVLARLNDSLWVQRLDEAQARLALAWAQRERLVNGASPQNREVARAEVDVIWVRGNLTARQLQRAIVLAKQKAITQEMLDERRHNFNLANAELKQAQARLAEVEAPARNDELRMAEARIGFAQAAAWQAQTMVDKTMLVAPSNGIILRVKGEPGEIIGPESPEPLFTMTNVNELRVRAFVEELDAASVSVGQSAYVTADGTPGVQYAGTVIQCAPYMVPKQMRNNMPGEHLDVKVREVVISIKDAHDLVVGLPVDVFFDPTRPGTPPLLGKSRTVHQNRSQLVKSGSSL